MFSSYFFPKKFGFWSIILQNRTKHHANFLAKSSYSPFWILALKNLKWASRDFMRIINSAFWTELNMTLKILVLCISSLQSSWHFVFWILWETKHPLNNLFFWSKRIYVHKLKWAMVRYVLVPYGLCYHSSVSWPMDRTVSIKDPMHELSPCSSFFCKIICLNKTSFFFA